VVEASNESPLLNPAILIRNWGSQLATLSIDGKARTAGKDFRQGILKGPFGDDLIVWIRLDRQTPVTMTLRCPENGED
jgi:hypothetical protein